MTAVLSFGEWLKARRKQLDLTQQELADGAGCSVGTIRKLERDARRPSKQLAELLAEILHIAPNEIEEFVYWSRGGSPAAIASFAQPPLAWHAPTPTNQIDATRYRLGPLLAEGGHGHVFTGVDSATGQQVIIKRLRPRLQGAAELQQGLDILETELRDVPQRQRRIRAAIDYSWQKLTDQERGLFQQLTVFRGGFLREAAQVVCGTNLRQLSRLVNKSFLQFDQHSGRYHIHELMRQYGAEKLAATNQLEASCDAHNNYFLAFIHQREADIKGRRQLAALREMHAEFENIRFAWFRASQRRNYTGIDKALDALILYFVSNQFWAAAVEFQKQALADLAPEPRGEPHPVWYRVASRMMRPRKEEQPLLKESLALVRKQKNPFETAYCLCMLGWSLVMTSSFEDGLKRLEEGINAFRGLSTPFYLQHFLGAFALALFKASQAMRAYSVFQQYLSLAQQDGDTAFSARNRNFFGQLNFLLGDFEASEKEFVAAATQYRELGQMRIAARMLTSISYVAVLRGEFAEATNLFEENVELIGEIDDTIIFGYSELLGLLANLRGEYERAKEILSSLEEIDVDPWFNSFGNRGAMWQVAIASYGLKDFASCRRGLHEALTDAVNHELKGCALLNLPTAALLLSKSDQPDRGVELLALAFHELGEWAGWLEKWALFAQLRADLERACGAEGFTAAWERGQQLDYWKTAESLLQELT